MSRKSNRKPDKLAAAAPQLTFAPKHESNPRILLFVLRCAGIFAALFCLWGWLMPDMRLWGFHHLNFLPAGMAIGLLAFAMLLLTPLGGKLIEQLSLRLSFAKKRSALLWSLFAVVLFFGFRVAVPLLGDGQLWIRELAWIGEFEFQGKSIPPDRTFRRKEPLSLLVHEIVFRATLAAAPPSKLATSQNEENSERRNYFRDTARNVYAVMAIAAGGILIFLLIRFARRYIADDGRALFFLALFSSGVWLLFFGYVENYAWASFWIVLCLISGIAESFPPRRFPWKTIAAFIMALGFHFAAAILAPAVLYLLAQLYFQTKDERSGNQNGFRKRSQFIALGFILLCLAGYVWVEGWKGWISIIPLLPEWTDDGYALLTWKHAVDIFNLLAHICIIGLVIWFALRTSKTTSLSEKTRDGFLSFAAAAGFIFVIIFSPNLGMARDWDLLAMGLWPVLLLGAWRLSQVNWSNLRSQAIAAISAIILLIPAVSVAVNVTEKASIERFKSLLALDRSRSAYGWENLALYFQREGDLEKRIDAWKHAVEVERNPRYLFNYAESLRLAKRPVEAAPYLLEAARMNPDFSEQLLFLSSTLVKEHKFDLALAVIDSAAALRPKDKYVPRVKTWIERAQNVDRLRSDGRIEEARTAAVEAQKKDPQNTYWKEVIGELEKENPKSEIQNPK